MKRVDVLTPIGLTIGVVMLFFAIISSGGLSGMLSFVDVPSLFVVIGGVLAGIFVSFPLKDLKQMGKVMRQAFSANESNVIEVIDIFVDLSSRARREGILSLERGIFDIKDRFLRKGIILTVDGLDAETITEILDAEIEAMEERHRKGRVILEKAGDYAPAWGMIGTLVGLVLMLKNLNDPSTLGPNMAIALLTTLYGSLLANLVFIPLASKLQGRTEREVFMKQVMIEGIIGIQTGQNPRLIEEKLSAFLSEEERRKMVEEDEFDGSFKEE